MSAPLRAPLVDDFYQQYLVDRDSAALIDRVSSRYSIGTLECLVARGPRLSRRAAVLALGLCGDFSSNAVLGRALQDHDRGVRMLADSGIRAIWCRFGNAALRRRLATVIRLNSSQRYAEAVRRAAKLLETEPNFAEVWNQRALAHFSLGRCEDSIRDCRQALELNAYHFGAASGMGQCYLQLGDRHAALESFRRALRLNPDLENIRASVAHLQRTLNSQE